ncbi:M23 family metallopeptidase [Alcaligenaceae bacterium 429]|uniref:M23 family metallopeptidase n=1 Tax=Paenalcaligenes sp. Me52 TaxID=3392038 RepID=UPI0010925DE4|nr:M23 family metallopeptidase [Alcaligenaceae bacterium 429]
MLEKEINGTTTATVRSKRTTSPARLIQKGLLVLALGMFAGAAAIAVNPSSGDDSKPVLYQARTTLDLPFSIESLDSSFSDPFIQETRIRRGDTLASVLQRLNIREEGLQQFLTHDKDARSIYKLYPGRTVRAALDENNQLQSLSYFHTPSSTENGKPASRWLEVRTNGEGGFTASEEVSVATPNIQVAEAEIRTSLFGATDTAGIPDSIALQIPEILGSKVDFIKDLRAGDKLRVIYETYNLNGQQVGSGRILALEFDNQGKTHEALWFSESSSGNGGSYYDANGQNLQGQGSFLRNALKFTRISSTFGGRRHPISGKWRGHKGVDYAAPSGTPIHATADGVVEFVGVQNGYGNVIILKHHSNYSTLYAHQSRFAQGLRNGDRVEQGQLIGYVGSTGWSTGPHLHYEFRVNGTPVDPLAIDLPVARKLEPVRLQAFQNQVGQYKTQLALLQSRHELLAANSN